MDLIPRALGIDLGEARIGLALSDELGMMAHPLETLNAREPEAAFARIVALLREKKAPVAVVGLPRNMDGSHGPASEKARAFGEALRGRAPDVDVQFMDERLSTVAAQRALHEAGRNTKQSRSVVDKVAAQMILQTWLDREAMKREMM